MECEAFLVSIKYSAKEKVELEVSGDLLLSDLKAIIFEALDIEVDRQKLTYKGKEMAEEKTLGEYGVKASSIIHMVSLKKSHSAQ